MRFEWDDRKRLANLEKHGLDFRRAVQVFDGPSFSYRSSRQYEER
ncbi:MAG: BrnT family toxin [Geminicoccaceae bacterium]